MKKLIIGIIVFIVIMGGFVFLIENVNVSKNTTASLQIEGNKKTTGEITKFGEGIEAVMYKEPDCGCCEGYAKKLREQGFDVKVIPTNNIDSIKNKYNIPSDKQSCHTISIENYFIEGHVPMEAVKKMIEEKPDISGIGLPKMPLGTAGMPGIKRAPYKVFKETNKGNFSNYMTI